MTDLEDKIRDALQDSRWELPAWPDPMSRVHRAAARQRARLAATTLVLLAAVVTPLALLPGLVEHRTGAKPFPIGTSSAPSVRPAATSVPSWASKLRGEVAYKCGNSICLMRPDGTGKRTLAATVPEWDPSWSPNGKSIAFVANPSAAAIIEVAAADGAGVHRVSPRSWTSYSPTWTPGGKIVFLRQIGAPTQSTAAPTSAYIVNRDGTHLRLLYKNIDAIQIAWGPAALPRGAC